MSTTAITVAVRVRPFNSREVKYKSTLVINMPDENNLEMIDPKRSATNPVPPRKFQFDHCMWTHSPTDPHYVDQKKVYDTIGSPILDNCMQGYNACLFAYGQTGSGKSYSMMNTPEDPGVIPRLCTDLFERAAKTAQTHSIFVECSYLEIYNEQVKDLLNPTNINKPLRVRQHPKLGVFVEGLKKIAARNAEEIAKLIDDGTQIRSIASTAMNATSSRSHAILTLSIRVKSTESETMSVLHLVDLAGSERADATGAEGQTLKEGANINKSLSVLGMCLGRLADFAEGKKGGHIPYRDSQLTWLLHESLGGNSKTAMLAALSPADINYEETLSTLRFASITKKIKMVVKINEDPQTKIIRELREQIAQIKEEIKALAEGRVYTRAPIEADLDDDNNVEGDSFDADQTAGDRFDAAAATKAAAAKGACGAGGAAGDALPPKEVDVDVRRQQLLEELEENTNLIVAWSMTEEQRRVKEEKERRDHEKLMAELKRGSKISSNDDEASSSCPKLLLLNEDLHNLRLGDGKPLQIVHSMIKPAHTNLDDDDDNNDNVALSHKESGTFDDAGGEEKRRSRSRSVVNNPKFSHTYTICGSSVSSVVNPDEDDVDSAIVPWLKLPAGSGLTALMRLEIVVDFHDHKMWLNFEDYSLLAPPPPPSSSSSEPAKEIVFVNGKPLRTISATTTAMNPHSATSSSSGSSRSSSSIFAQIGHNDRIIVGSVIFRVFEPIAWRVDELGGQDESFVEDPVSNVDHVQMLETYNRHNLENVAFESFFIAVFGEEELEGGKLFDVTTAGSHSSSPTPRSRAQSVHHHQHQHHRRRSNSAASSSSAASHQSTSNNNNNNNLFLSFNNGGHLLDEIKNQINSFASESRLLKVQAEERLIEHYPRDIRRELRSRDVKDAIKYDGKFALNERATYLKEKQKEQDELRRKLEEGSAEIEKLQETLEQRQREREEADRRAKEALESEVQAALEKAKHEAELRRRQGILGSSAGAVPSQVAAVKTSAQGKLQLARRVHEYEELRRELMAWKPIGPADPKDKPIYQLMSDSMSKIKPVQTYLEVRKQFDESVTPLFEGNIFKNRIKTGFFSRGGLHPVTALIIDHFLFYFEAGAGLVSPAASQTKMIGFAFILGCEFGSVLSTEGSSSSSSSSSSSTSGSTIEGKPAVRVVSAAPRKANQGKTDPHHALEFAFANAELKEQFVRALATARLPIPDSDVAAALAKLDSQ